METAISAILDNLVVVFDSYRLYSPAREPALNRCSTQWNMKMVYLPLVIIIHQRLVCTLPAEDLFVWVKFNTRCLRKNVNGGSLISTETMYSMHVYGKEIAGKNILPPT